jgi:hypothetical protein
MQVKQTIVYIPTSDAIDISRKIARDEGYDVRYRRIYYFDLLTASDGQPFLKGYTSMGFYINGDARNLILINDKTGQAMDMNSCEIFDYPDLKPFQDQMTQLTKSKRLTPLELANDAGCNNPKVLTKPVPIKPMT